MKIYIYSFINKLNGHRYIGKTNNVERRRREHKSMAFNPKVIETHDCLWYKKIRQYGWDNFDFEILDVANEDNWKEKEKYWISYYNTFNGVGYNTTPGGDGEGYGGILSDEEVEGICYLLEDNQIPQAMIAIEYGVSQTLVSNINCGLRYKDSKRTYPIRKNYKNGLGDYEILVQLLKTTVLSFREIAEKLNIAESSVKKINYGMMQYDDNIIYPIRKFDTRVINLMEKELIFSSMSIEDIAKKHNKTVKYVENVNQGKTNKKDLLEKLYGYPLRK